MAGVESDPTAWVRRLTETYASIRFGRGVVGKTGHAMIAVLIVWAIIAWRLTGSFYSDLLLVLVGAIATSAFIWWTRSTQNFAHDNPAQAMLEGAEFLEYQKFEAQAKGLPPASQSVMTVDPRNPPSLLPPPEEAD